jgi:uncharacterized damage-inducible protein DinB
MITPLDILAYDRWANHKYLVLIATLDSEQYARKLGGSFGSIRDTLVHLAWAEWVWVERWQGRSPQVRASPDQYPTVSSVQSYLKEVEEAQVRVFELLPREAMTTQIRYTNLKNEVWEYSFEQMLHHLIMHSAYHRGQLATLLRQLDFIPPTTDYLDYIDTQKAAATSPL